MIDANDDACSLLSDEDILDHHDAIAGSRVNGLTFDAQIHPKSRPGQQKQLLYCCSEIDHHCTSTEIAGSLSLVTMPAVSNHPPHVPPAPFFLFAVKALSRMAARRWLRGVDGSRYNSEVRVRP